MKPELLPPSGRLRSFVKKSLVAALAWALFSSCTDETSNEEDLSGEFSQRKSLRSREISIEGGRIDQLYATMQRARETQSPDSVQELLDGLRKMSVSELESVVDQNIESAQGNALTQFLVFQSLKLIAESRPELALGYFSRAPGMGIARYGFSDVAGVVAKTNPSVLVEWLSQPEISKSASGVFKFGISALAELEPKMAFGVYVAVGNEVEGSALALQSIFLSYGESDPAEAAFQAKKFLKGVQLENALGSIGMAIFGSDPRAALEFVDGIDNELFRDAQSADLLGRWATKDPDAAIGYIAGLEGGEIQRVLNSKLLTLILDNDASIGKTIIDSTIPTKSNEWIFRRVISHVAISNPTEAGRMIDGFPESALKDRMLQSVCSALVENDVSSALKFASEYVSKGARASVLGAMGHGVGSKGVDEALEMSNSLSGADRGGFLIGALDGAKNHELDKVVGLLQSKEIVMQLPAGGEREKLVASTLQKYCLQDSENAMAMVDKIPVEIMTPAVEGVAKGLAQVDVGGLGEWLTSRPRDEAWRAGARVLVEEIKDSDPESAAQWTQLLLDSDN